MSDRIEITESVRLAAPPDTVWSLVGDYARVAEWHPGITTCQVDPDGITRRVQIGMGLTVVNVLEARDDDERWYTYNVADGRWPIHGIRVTFRVREHGQGCAVDIDASLVPQMNEATRMARGFWRAALDSLGRRFGRLP